MQQTSATWKRLWTAGAALEARATIDGTVYTDISAPVIHRAAMPNALSIGKVAAASLSLVIRGAGNIPRSAAVVVEARLNDGETTSEWLPQGTFYISRRARDPVTGQLALECYDALLKAQAVVTELPWTTRDGAPITTAGGDRIMFRAAPAGDMESLAKDMALLLGLEIDPRSVIQTGAPYEITSPDAGATIRDILSIIAQANGGNWIVTPRNRLRLVPVEDVSGAAEATEDAVDVDGVTGGIRLSTAADITGIRGTVENDAWLIGDDTGIVLEVSLAPVIATELAEAMLGRRYQAYSLSGAVCDPAAELGDFVRAGVHGEIASALYDQQVTLGPACRCDMGAPGGGEITDEYPYIGAGAKTLTLAKAYAREVSAGAVEQLNHALTQQEIFNRLTDGGAAQGVILYNGQLYINASYINTGYLNANHIQGGTLTLGGQNNQNGLLRVLNAAGQEIGTWTKDGIQISAGRIQLSQETLTSSVEVILQQSITEPFKIIYNSNLGEIVTKLVGEFFSIKNTDNDCEIRFGPEELYLSDGSTVWFYLSYNNGSPYMSIYGNALIEGDTRIKGNLTLDNALTIGGDLSVSGTVTDKRILQATYALSIPSAGSTTTGYITGLTSDHQLVRWNFSDSPENIPPVDLEWETWDGYFTVTNNGGTTSESITPVFILPE